MQTHEPPWDLLSQPLLPFVRCDGSQAHATLPGLFAALQREDVTSFPTLQDHQLHAWHAFLVQLAAIAIHRADATTEPTDEATWRDRLLALTDGTREPWCLVVEDLSKPAFMQPPVPEGTLDRFRKWGKEGTRFPDEIDMLVTTKNHDVKTRRISHPLPSHWVFALLTTQTMDGYGGRSNYGIVRMNSGLGNRPAVSYSPSLFPYDRFCRDLAVLSETRDFGLGLGFASRGHALLWVIPWDGSGSISLLDCDPYFIEVCRRIRLRTQGTAIHAFGGPTQGARIAAGETKGRTGDPWTPIRSSKQGEEAALTVSRNGFTYQLTYALIANDGYQPGATLRLRSTDPREVLFTATAMVRGQGKTEGIHERVIPITPGARRLLGSSEGRKTVGNLARARIDEVAQIKLRALKPALLQILQGAPESLTFKDNRADAWLDRLDDAVDRVFFDDLWASLEEAKEEPHEDAWARRVFDLAEELLEEAFDSMPVFEARRYRAIAAAQRTFYGRRKQRLGPTQKGAVQ